jgi:hypothetical protein
MDPPPAYRQSQPSCYDLVSITTESAPASREDGFRAALIFTHVAPASVDSEGLLQPAKALKTVCTSVIMHRDLTAYEFHALLWQKIHQNFEVHGWTRRLRNDAELSAATSILTVVELRAAITRMALEYDAGRDPVETLTFTFLKGEGVRLEMEHSMAFLVRLSSSLHSLTSWWRRG